MAKGLAVIADEQHKQNAVFYATLIKDDGQATRMIDYLLMQGVQACALDHLNQTALFYAAREGKSGLVDQLMNLGCPPNHVDSYG